MSKRILFTFGAFILSFASVAAAKSYSFTLTAATKAGTVNLKAGDYQVELKGTQAIFTNADGKTIKVDAKVEQAAKKFDITLVDAGSNGVLKEIDLGGTTTKLEFAQ